MPITSSFDPVLFQLNTSGDSLANLITHSRNAAGNILVNGGAVTITGGIPTVANTGLIQVFGQDSNDTMTTDESFGAMPATNMFGGLGDDTMTGGSAGDQLFGEDNNDILLGRGGTDVLRGGAGNDTLTGGDAQDQMFGDDGDDRMIWNPGDDSDLMEGGIGTDTAQVNGGSGAETFTATANGTRVRFDRLNPGPFALDIGTTERLVVNMNGGDDAFSAIGNLAVLIALTIDGGAGNDTILGGNGADVIFGDDGNDFVDGGQANDIAVLGDGNDVFQWDPGDGSDIVEGQADTDTLLFNGSVANERFVASANGGRLFFTRDIANIVMDADDVENLTINAGAGTDSVTVNDLTGTDVTAIAVNLAGTIGGSTGDGVADNVALAGRTGDDVVSVVPGALGAYSVSGLPALVNVNQHEAIDRLTINGLGGNDTIDASAITAAMSVLTIIGGTGNDTLKSGGDGAYFGDAGDDLIFAGVTNSSEAIDGGADTDTLDTTSWSGPYIISMVTGATNYPGESFINFENLVTGAGDDTITGTPVANIIRTNGGTDTIDGAAGNDTLNAGTANDTINGGAGVDTAAFAGPRAAYTIEAIAGGVRVSGPDGIDTLSDIERLAFDDITVARPLSDVNGDFRGDLLWQHAGGLPAQWLMNGTDLAGSAVGPLNPGPAWHLKGAGDFNGDDRSDLLLQHDSGLPAIWLMDGTTIIGGGPGPGNPGPQWHVKGAADFDGDGKADVLWQHDDGTAALWLMDGLNQIGGGILGLNPGPTWHIVGAGDFNGDGKADILWQHDSGLPAIWLMDGANMIGGGAAGPLDPGPQWHIKDAGDFNADGRSDILWQHDNGQPAVWLMNGLSLIGGGEVVGPGNPGMAWHAKGASDVNADGRADILWQHDSGPPAIWLMDGASLIGGGMVGPGGIGPDWQLIG